MINDILQETRAYMCLYEQYRAVLCFVLGLTASVRAGTSSVRTRDPRTVAEKAEEAEDCWRTVARP